MDPSHWSVSGIVAVLSCLGGFVMMYLGYCLSARLEAVKDQITNGIQKASAAVESVTTTTTSGAVPNAALTATPNAALTAAPTALPDNVVNAPAEYVKALTDLAKALNGLTPAVAAFVVCTILFMLASLVAILDHALH